MVKRIVLMLAIAVGLAAEVGAAFNAGRITVTTTAQALYTAQRRGSAVLLCNRHSASVYIGPSSVTTANGFEIAAGACTTQRPYPNDAIWFVVGAATARVDYAEGMYREP